jgi:hypothetical protein
MSNRKQNGATGATGSQVAAAVAQSIQPMPPNQLSFPELKANGLPLKGSMMNALKALDAMNIECVYDFHSRCTINGVDLKQYQGELSDKVTRVLRELSFKRFQYEPGKDAMYDAVLRACESHWYDPLVEYLDNLDGKWDGKKRLDKWLTTYFGADDTELHAAWGRLTLLAAVARAYNHGIKYDHVLVLESPEGDGKSSAIRILAGGGDYFSDSTILGKPEKEQMELTQGVWFYEIGELAGMSRHEGRQVKAFVVRQEERARPAYGRFKEVQPRIAVFIGTFNTTADRQTIEYLNVGDNRRWWPLPVKTIKLEALAKDRDQLFAEARAEWIQLTGGKSPVVDIENRTEHHLLRLDPSLWAAAGLVQKAREKTDPLVDRLSMLARVLEKTLASDSGRDLSDGGYLRNLTCYRLIKIEGGRALERDGIVYALMDDEGLWISSTYLGDILGLDLRADGNRVAAAMRKLHWKGPVRDRRSGLQTRGYSYTLDPLA